MSQGLRGLSDAKGASYVDAWGEPTRMKTPFEVFPYTEKQAKFALAVIGLLLIGLIITALLYGLKVFAE